MTSCVFTPLLRVKNVIETGDINSAGFLFCVNNFWSFTNYVLNSNPGT